MSRITPMLDNSHVRKSGVYPVVVRVSHKAQKRLIPTDYSVELKQWDDAKKEVRKHAEADIINAKIAEKVSEVKNYLADCKRYNRAVNLFRIGKVYNNSSFTEYLQERGEAYKAKKMNIMYRRMNRFKEELQACLGDTVYYEELTTDALRKYDAYLVQRGNAANTRAKKFKTLRELFENARDEGKTIQPNVFKSYKINTTPVKKSKLNTDAIYELEKLVIVDTNVRIARDMFLFSYYCKGARFENCLLFLKRNIAKDRIFFTTNKGKKHISVKIHSRMQAIIDLYSNIEGPYLFPLIFKEVKPDDKQNIVNTFNTLINRYLKIIAAMAAIKTNLTFHIARHSFANQLKQVTDSIHVIKDSLGHSDSRTTEMYLNSLGDERLDEEMEKLYGA